MPTMRADLALETASATTASPRTRSLGCPTRVNAASALVSGSVPMEGRSWNIADLAIRD